MGIDANGKLVLLTLTGEMNIPGMSIALADQGVKDAILLGGSGDSQLVVYNGRPVLAKERKDKNIDEGSTELRKVAQGLIFYSKAKDELGLLQENILDLWKQDRNEKRSSLGVFVLTGGEDGVLSENIKSAVINRLKKFFYLVTGEEKYDLTQQEVFALWGEEYLIPQLEQLEAKHLYSTDVIKKLKMAVMTGDVKTFNDTLNEETRYGIRPYIKSVLVTRNFLQKGIQRFLLKEKMPRSEVINRLGLSSDQVRRILNGRLLDDLDTQEFLRDFILDQRDPREAHEASITKFIWNELQDGGSLNGMYTKFSDMTKEFSDKKLDRLIIGVYVPSLKDVNHFVRNIGMDDAKRFQSAMSNLKAIPQKIKTNLLRSVESSL